MSRTYKPDVSHPPNTLARLVRALAVLALSLVPAALQAQGDTTFATWMRFRGAPPLTLTMPAILRSPWAAGPRPPTAQVLAVWDSAVGASRDSAFTAQATDWRLRRIYGRTNLTMEDSLAERQGLLGISRRYVDLSIDGSARMEVETERLKNLRCTPAALLDPNSGCQGGFKAPRLDTYLAMRSGGLIGRRLHVNIDYDSERDFNARNNLQIYYEGLDNEVVRRVEVGTVTFQPPPSRFITAAIPANNFGVNATFDIGALRLQGVAATQSGSVLAERSYSIGSTTVQPQDREARDLDFEAGRFFWVVDPQGLPAYPAIDILNINPGGLPPTATISQADVRVYRYRPPTTSSINPNLGGITAIAIGADTTQRANVVWQPLQRDVDFYVDPSGLWFALAARLDQNDYLAVSYRSAAGLVGTFPSQDRPPPAGGAPLDTLRLIVQPKVDASRPTFRHEMRQIYRVAGADLDPNSLIVNLSLNRSEHPQRPGALATYLAELGLATPADPTSLNLQDRLFPRARDPSATVTIKDSYIVFPALNPFADAAHLTAAERNDTLYRTPGYLLFSEGPSAKFIFRLRYNAGSAGDRSSLDLGALQIRDGSETLYYNGQRLTRGLDYTINYDLGQVTFLTPRILNAGSAGALQARFEERGVFAVAPTQIYGLATRYSLGDVGGVNLLGIYQVEKSAFNRPQLGFEAKAHMVGGISTDLSFRPMGVTRLLNHLTTGPTTAPSRLDFNAELALTRPDPNRSGQAYVESFEGDPGTPIALSENAWSLGSRPRFTDGVDDQPGIGLAFDTADAVQLTWQNLIPNGNVILKIRASDIDPQIRLAGSQDQLESALFVALQADTAGGYPKGRAGTLQWVLPTRLNHARWRSMVTPLSTSGVDLSRNEFLEFWVFESSARSATNAGTRLVFDLGSVSEDAIAIAPESLTVIGGDSIFKGRQLVGLHRLDSEVDPTTNVYNAASDDNGILADRPDSLIVGDAVVRRPALCRLPLGTAVNVYPWGDLGERCSNANGRLDTEDLDGDNRLDANGSNDNVFRWVVDLRNSPYFVRDGVVQPDSGGWRLYRIPLRTPGFTLGSPEIRLIKQLRVTVTADADNNAPDLTAKFAVARMRFLGAPWVRRSDAPIAGLAGSSGSAVGTVIASTVSTQNTELGYTSPPGVISGTNQKGVSETGSQINERSLRLIGKGLSLGQRAEAYFRFPNGAQGFLGYEELRAWVRGRGPGWGPTGDFQALLRVGSDSRNFYQYTATADTATWGQEVRIALSRWRSLHASLESRRLAGLPADSAVRVACGGDSVSTAYVLCDGPYLVYSDDAGINPPNLARVQEIGAAIYRRGTTELTDSAEVWVDDIRMAQPISRVGSAVSADLRLVASDVGDISVGYLRQDGYFQQIGQNPSYRTTGTFRLASGVALDRFLPRGLGIVLPVQVGYTRSDVTQQLLQATDIEGAQLAGLRQPSSWSLSSSFALRRTERGRSWLVRGFIDPLSISGTLTEGRDRSELSQATSSAHSLQAGYLLINGPRGATLNLDGLVRLLPGFLRKSEMGDGLRRPFLDLVPGTVRLSSGLTRTEGDLIAFDVPVARPDDGLRQPSVYLSHLWRNSAGLTWRPLGMLTVSGDLASTRDLRRYADSTALGRLAGESRRTFFGLDAGVERDRQLGTSLALTPRIVSWLRPRFLSTSSFVLSRSLSSRDPTRLEGDTAGGFILPQTLSTLRTNELGFGLELGRLLGKVLGDSSRIGQYLRRLRSVDVSDRISRSSTFDLATFSPDLGFELGLGGLPRFLEHRGDSAIAASESRSTSLNSGADLGGGISLLVGYTRTRTSRFQRVSSGFLESETRQREWPKGSLRFSRTIRRGPLTAFGLGMSGRSVQSQTTLPSVGGTTAISETKNLNLAPDASLTFRNGILLTLGYVLNRSSSRYGGNEIQQNQKDINLGLNYAFQLPSSISRTPRQIRSSFAGVLSRGTSCLASGDSPICINVSDSRRKEVRANFDTDFGRMLSGGLQFSYALRDVRNLDQKFSQLILALNFQLSLFSGDYR